MPPLRLTASVKFVKFINEHKIIHFARLESTDDLELSDNELRCIAEVLTEALKQLYGIEIKGE